MASADASSSKLSINSIPSFSGKKEDFDDYEFLMLAFFDGLGCKHVVENPPTQKSESSGGDGKKTDEQMSKEAFSIILRSVTAKQRVQLRDIPAGNSYLAWAKLKATYGVVESTDSAESLYDQVRHLKKSNKQSLDDFLAAFDLLVAKLKVAGDEMSPLQQKYHLLQALSFDEKWKEDVAHVQRSQHDGSWDRPKLEKYLRSQENVRLSRAASALASKPDEQAHWNHEQRGRGARGGFRGRGRGGGFNPDFKRNEQNNGGNNRGNFRGGRGAYRGNSQTPQRQLNDGAKAGGDDARETRTCFYCNRKGHISRDCFKKQKDKERAMHAHDNGDANGDDEENEEFSFMVSEREVHTITEYVDVSFHAHVASTEWVLDTGASRHFTCDRSLLSDIKTISPVTVDSTNGTSTFSITGKVKLNINGKSCTLNDVAYVEDFKVNLISVSRITEKKYIVSYDDKEAIIRRKGSNKTLYTVPKRGKIYIHSETADKVYLAGDHEQTRVDVYHDDVSVTDDGSPDEDVSVTNDGSSDDVDVATEGSLDEEDEKEVDPEAEKVNDGPKEADKSHNDSVTIEQMKREMRMLHRRYGHVSYGNLWKLIKHDSVIGVSRALRKLSTRIIDELVKEECQGCLLGKFNRLPMTGIIKWHANDVMDVWVSDVIGPMSIQSLGSHEYVLTHLDVKTKRVMVSLMKHKRDAAGITMCAIKKAQLLLSKVLKRFHSDGGGEFINKELELFFDSQGTEQTHTTLDTPQHNSLAERVGRTLLEMVKSLLHHAGAPMYLWGEAFMLAAYLLERRISNAHSFKTPFELWFNRKPNVSRLHVFGCDVYYYEHKKNREFKLGAASRRGVFLGYEKHNDTYFRIYDVETRKIVITREVKFFDDKFMNAILLRDEEKKEMGVNDEKLQSENEKVQQQFTADDFVDDVDYVDIERIFENVAYNQPIAEVNVAAGNQQPIHQQNDEAVNQQAVVDQQVNNVAVENNANNDNSRQRLVRNRVPPKEIYVTKDHRIKNKREKKNEQAMMSNDDDEPKSYHEAVNGADAKHWKAAIKDELDSMKTNHVFETVTRKSDMNVIQCRWVFKKKKDVKGVITRYKARLVAKGYNQQYGVDYSETFAPVMNQRSFRVLLALGVISGDCEIDQMDIKTAFLNATVKEDIYVSAPDGVTLNSDKVLKLKRALYGIKQAPKEWNANINAFFIEQLGFKPCIKDTCLYFKRSQNKKTMMIGLFVDDVTSVYRKCDKSEWLFYKNIMKKKYDVSDLGRVHHILGMRVRFEGDKLYIDQQVYVNEKLKAFDMNNCRELAVPESSVQLVAAAENELLDEKQTSFYKSITGALIYAVTSTRPDIAHAVNMLARHMAKPGSVHLDAARRVLRYLQGTQTFGLMYEKTSDEKQSEKMSDEQLIIITAFTDSDWGGDRDGAKSTSGYCIFINGNLISWQTKKQPTVALSTAEAEYMAAVEVVKEVMWLQQLLGELHCKVKTPIEVFIDNQSAIAIAKDDVQHDRTKHINIKYHFVKEEVKNKNIELIYVRSENNVADIFTKAVEPKKFAKFSSQLMKRL
jgi:hypothetical protein